VWVVGFEGAGALLLGTVSFSSFVDLEDAGVLEGCV
jgi:hypothetical protein